MNPIFLSICLALHTLSTVLLVGNYILSALVVVPVLRRLIPEEENNPGCSPRSSHEAGRGCSARSRYSSSPAS